MNMDQSIKRNKNQRCASKSPRCSKALTLSGPLFINRNKSPEAKKMTFFKIFFDVAHLLIETKLFCFIKISYLQPFREIMGGQRIRTFSAKMTPQAKKMTFFRIFFSLAHLHTEAQLFCFYQNFISSAVQRNQGGTRKKRYINDEQRRTTTNYNDELH